MLDPQPLGNRSVEITRAESQFVGQFFGHGVEIGKMVAPALNFAANRLDRIGCAALCSLAAGRAVVKKTNERFRRIGRCDQPFFQFGPIDRQVFKQRIREPLTDRIDSAARLCGDQLPWVEVEPVGQQKHQTGAHGPLVSLDQIEIAGRNIQRLGQSNLGHAGAAPKSLDRGAREEFLGGHASAM